MRLRNPKSIFVGLLLLGVVFSFTGVLSYLESIPNADSLTQGTLIVGWVPIPGRIYLDQWFTLELDVVRRTALIQYDISFTEPGQYILQVYFPFTVQSMSSPTQPSGPGSWTFVNVLPYGSIVRVAYQANSSDFDKYGIAGAGFSTILHLNQSIAQNNRGTYTMLLPAHRGIPAPLSDVASSLLPRVGVVDSGARHNVYHVYLPPEAVVVQTLPANPSLDIAQDNSLELTWDLGNFLPALDITYSMLREVGDYAGHAFWGGIFIGIGVSTAIASLMELCKLVAKRQRV